MAHECIPISSDDLILARTINGGVQSATSGEEQRENEEGGVAIANERAATTAGRSTVGNRTSAVAAGRRRISEHRREEVSRNASSQCECVSVVGGHRMVVRNKRQMPVVAAVSVKKQAVAANPINGR